MASLASWDGHHLPPVVFVGLFKVSVLLTDVRFLLAHCSMLLALCGRKNVFWSPAWQLGSKYSEDLFSLSLSHCPPFWTTIHYSLLSRSLHIFLKLEPCPAGAAFPLEWSIPTLRVFPYGHEISGLPPCPLLSFQGIPCHLPARETRPDSQIPSGISHIVGTPLSVPSCTVLSSVADPESGILCLFYLASGIGNRVSLDPGSQTHIFESLVTIFWVKSSIILWKLARSFFLIK